MDNEIGSNDVGKHDVAPTQVHPSVCWTIVTVST